MKNMLHKLTVQRSAKLLTAVSILLLSHPSKAQVSDSRDFPIPVYTTSSGESVMNAPASGLLSRSGQDSLTIRVQTSCFASNLRRTADYPIAPNSIITSNMTINVNGVSIPLRFTFPGDLVTENGLVPEKEIASMDPSQYAIPGGGSAGIYGNTVQLEVPINTLLTLKADGTPVSGKPKPVFIENYSFSQVVPVCTNDPWRYEPLWKTLLPKYGPQYPCGEQMANTGVATGVMKGISAASDNSTIEIAISFAGQAHFCGGKFSPLMVFFDEGRPTFTNQSRFPLKKNISRTAWPEANAPGYFLFYDQTGKGQITQGEQLFGDSKEYRNGFDSLARLDLNKDKMISANDKAFRFLYLWQDRNGDGVAQKDEVVSAAQKLQKISLKYQAGHLRPLGRFAEEREKSVFWYRNAKGKSKKGSVVDIWLSPAPTELLAQSNSQ